MKYLKNLSDFIATNQYMIVNLVKGDLKKRYSGSFLGLIWSILHPLSSLLIYYFVFSVVLKIKLGPGYGDANFTMWLLAGLLPWLFFTEVLMRTNIIVENANLIKKTTMPSEYLPLSATISALFNHFVGLVIFVILMAGFGFTIQPTSVYIFIYLLVLIPYTLGLAWLLSALNVYLRDVSQLMAIITNIWFYMTPIIYPFDAVPDTLKLVLKINPMYYVVEGYRLAVFSHRWVDLNGFVYMTISGIVSFLLGRYIFKRLKSGFSDIL